MSSGQTVGQSLAEKSAELLLFVLKNRDQTQEFYQPNNQAQAPLSQESAEGVLQLMEDLRFRKVRTLF